MKNTKKRVFTEEAIQNLTDGNTGEKNGMYGKTHSEETRKKIGAKATGRKQSDETIQKKIAASLGTKRKKKLCPHCLKEVAVNGYARWHGDNCKLNK